MLREDLLPDYDLSVSELAEDLGVSLQKEVARIKPLDAARQWRSNVSVAS